MGNTTDTGHSLDGDVHGADILKGDIVIGAIAGEEARVASDQEHNLKFVEALKLYPTAVGWSLFFSLGYDHRIEGSSSCVLTTVLRIIMTAFDPQLLGNLYATPAFQRDFGYLYEGEYIISAPWQTGLSMVSRNVSFTWMERLY